MRPAGRGGACTASQVVLIAGMLVGCAVQTPESRIAAVAGMTPGSWAATPEGRAGVDAQWIDRFGDRGLSSLVDEAMSNNYNLQVVAERVKRAEASSRLAGAAARPQVSAGLQGRKQEQRFTGLPFGGSSISESYGASVDTSWEIDLWGKIRAGHSAALGELQAAGYDLHAARISLGAQIAKAWFALQEANEQIALAKDGLRIRIDTEAATRERFNRALDGEGGSASQVRLAQTDVATAKADVALWEGERARVLRQIELLAGRYPKGRNLSSSGLPKLPPRPPAGLPSELLLRRPDILAAERRFAASGRRVDEARLAKYPSFSLNGSLGTSTDSLDEVLDSDFGIWSFGAGVVQPILTGGRLTEGQRIQESDERAALGDLQQTVLTAFGEVEQALALESYLARRTDALAEANRLAIAAAKSAEQDYVDGTGDFLTRLLADSRKIEVGRQLAGMRRLQLDNRVNLHLALGGSFSTKRK
jgi:multidrug efflux system outer membrane protein